MADNEERATAYALDEGQEVGCYFCMKRGRHTTYRRGEAFLVDAGYDGNANYVCKAHLDEGVVIVARLSAPSDRETREASSCSDRSAT